MARSVFISYRRADSAAYAGRIADYLARARADINAFMDVNAIQPGDDFIAAIERNIGAVDVVLALIGDRWLDAKGADGARRLDDPRDFVRLELAAGLDGGARMIPVLLDGAPMPAPEALPAPLRELSRRSAFPLRHERFARDVEDLAELIATAPQRAAAVPPPAAAPEIIAALDAAFTRFIGMDDPDAFMIVEDAQSHFVQFIGATEGEVMLDLPTQPLTPSQLLAAQRLLSETYAAAHQDLDGGNFAFQLTAPAEPAYLARVTLEIFQHIYGVIPRAPLSVNVGR